MTSFLINGTLAVDAGAITRALAIPEQHAIRHVLVSHTHMDHTASLPFLIENSFETKEPISIYCTKEVLVRVRQHLFNNDTWPDFTRIPDHHYPMVRFKEVRPNEPFAIAGLPGGDFEVTAIPVNHVVPTVGFLIRQGATRIIYTADTGPTEEIWKVANEVGNLAALITECSFPNCMQDIADVSLHFTPQGLAQELRKVNNGIPVYLYHLKPPYLKELRHELGITDLGHTVKVLEQDRTYTF